jgi:hypothetical protein
MSGGKDKGRAAVEGEVASAAPGADDSNPTGHSLGSGIGPAGAALGAHKEVSLGKEPGHFILGQVQIKIVRDGRADERPRVQAPFPDQAVEQDKAEPRKAATETLHGPDDVSDPLSSFENPAVTEDLKLSWRGGKLGGPRRKRVRGLGERIKYPGVDASDGSPARHPVSSFDAAAQAFGVAKKEVGATGDFFLHLVAGEDEIEILDRALEAVELGQDRVLAAEGDVEFLSAEVIKARQGPLERQPIRPLSARREQDKMMAPADELIPNLQIAADSAKDFDVGKEGGDPHRRLNVA